MPTPRSQWKLGKIDQVISGADQVIRGVKLTTHSKQGKITTVHRPIQKIIPFEVSSVPEPPSAVTSPSYQPSTQPPAQSESEKGIVRSVAKVGRRSRRRAAIIGEESRRLRSKFS